MKTCPICRRPIRKHREVMARLHYRRYLASEDFLASWAWRNPYRGS